MYCANCGKELKDGAKFCSACGAAQTSTQDETNNNSSKGRETSKSKKRNWIVISIISLVILLILIGALESLNPEEKTQEAGSNYSMEVSDETEQSSDVVQEIVEKEETIYFEDALVERCVRHALGKELDEAITKKECEGISSLVIDCNLDISFDTDRNAAIGTIHAYSYVDLSDLQYFTGLKELYIDNRRSDVITNLEAISNCKELKTLCLRYDPSQSYETGDVGKGYKYLSNIVNELESLEYLDLGHYVSPEYKNEFFSKNTGLTVFDGNNDEYIENSYYAHKWGQDFYLAETVEEYLHGWAYGYNGYTSMDSYEVMGKASLRVESQEDLDKVLGELPPDTEDIFLVAKLEKLDLKQFTQFQNLQSLSIVGVGFSFSEERTELTNIELLRECKYFHTLNLWGCSGAFQELGDCKTIKELALLVCDFESPDFLGDLEELRELTLQGIGCDALPQYLENSYGEFEKLKFLKLCIGGREEYLPIQNVYKAPKIETLVIESQLVSLEGVRNCNNLKHFIDTTYRDVIDVEPLADVKTLETFYSAGGKVSNLDKLIQLSNLVSVDVQDINESTDDMYDDAVNSLFDMAISNSSVSYFNPIRHYVNGDMHNDIDYSSINFRKLLEADIYDGTFQRKLYNAPFENYTFEDIFTRN